MNHRQQPGKKLLRVSVIFSYGYHQDIITGLDFFYKFVSFLSNRADDKVLCIENLDQCLSEQRRETLHLSHFINHDNFIRLRRCHRWNRNMFNVVKAHAIFAHLETALYVLVGKHTLFAIKSSYGKTSPPALFSHLTGEKPSRWPLDPPRYLLDQGRFATSRGAGQKNVLGFHLDSLKIFFLLRPILVSALLLALPYFPNLPPIDTSFQTFASELFNIACPVKSCLLLFNWGR